MLLDEHISVNFYLIFFKFLLYFIAVILIILL